MKYYEQLGLIREPFSSSPDPGFLFYSKQHISCLQELEIAVRLKRGLNLVVGDIGTGKTTLCRRFVRNLSKNPTISVSLLLDPAFPSAHAFLRLLCAQFCGELPDRRLNTWTLKEMIKRSLLQSGTREDKTVVLIIDEGQKMSVECLEILRELLNYETNNSKLLQIIIFGQKELEPMVAAMPNFLDRINFYHRLRPLGFDETRRMIEFRLLQALPVDSVPPRLFSLAALYAIHRAAGGFPRKVVRLCHKVLLRMIIERRAKAGFGLVRACLREEYQLRRTGRWVYAGVAALLLTVSLATVRYVPEVRAMLPVLDFASAAVRGSDEDKRLEALPGLPGTQAELHLGTDAREDTTLSSGSAPLPQDLPVELGSLCLERGDSLSEALHRVYGVFDQENLDHVLAANPDLTDPDDVPLGTAIRFPLIRPDAREIDPELSWLRLDASSNLRTAYRLLRQYAFFGLELRLLTTYSSPGGLRFHVVLERPFLDSQEAEAARAGLPLALQQETMVFHPSARALVLSQSNSLVRETVAQRQ